MVSSDLVLFVGQRERDQYQRKISGLEIYGGTSLTQVAAETHKKKQKVAAVQLNIVYIYIYVTPVSEMIYTVSSGTLNCTIPYHIGTDVC